MVTPYGLMFDGYPADIHWVSTGYPLGTHIERALGLFISAMISLWLSRNYPNPSLIR